MSLDTRSLGVAFCLLLAGCAALPRQEAVPVKAEGLARGMRVRSGSRRCGVNQTVTAV